MQGATKERWMELCEQASVEKDPDKLMQLVQEINDILGGKQDRLGRDTPPNTTKNSG